MMLGGLSLKIRQVLVMEATEIIFVFVNSPYSKSDNRVLGTLTFKGVRYVEEANQTPRSPMEVRCSVSEMTVLCVAVVTVESADRALMPASAAVRAGT